MGYGLREIWIKRGSSVTVTVDEMSTLPRLVGRSKQKMINDSEELNQNRVKVAPLYFFGALSVHVSAVTVVFQTSQKRVKTQISGFPMWTAIGHFHLRGASLPVV